MPDSFWISLRYFNLYRIALAALFLGAALVYGDALNLGSHNLALFRYVAAGYLFCGVGVPRRAARPARQASTCSSRCTPASTSWRSRC